jgi:hypothetical protein
MKAAADPLHLPRELGGPAAAVVVALAGAALVAVGLLLIGVRDTKVGQWAPGLPSITLDAEG